MHSFYCWLQLDGVICNIMLVFQNLKYISKLKVFLWLVKQRRNLTKDNMVKRGWQWQYTTLCLLGLRISRSCFGTILSGQSNLELDCFLQQLFVYWYMYKDIWFSDSCIPLKDKLLLKIFRGAVFWVLWKERNKLYFQDGTLPLWQLKVIEFSLWQHFGGHTYYKLTIVLPCTVEIFLYRSKSDSDIHNIRRLEASRDVFIWHFDMLLL